MNRYINRIDKRIVTWMEMHGLFFLRISLAIVFIWFGLLKVVGASPAGDLVVRTVFWWDPSWFLPILGLWECVIGVCFLFQKTIRIAILLMAFQMIGTFFPFFVLPGETFTGTILTPTMEGQYIIKNIVLIAAAIVIGSHARDKQRRK